LLKEIDNLVKAEWSIENAEFAEQRRREQAERERREKEEQEEQRRRKEEQEEQERRRRREQAEYAKVKGKPQDINLGVLGLKVDRNISKQEMIDRIKKAYRKKSMETHPDKGGSGERFKKIQSAYDELRKYYQFAPNM
jgi:curved DNA-binding protein CbpA